MKEPYFITIKSDNELEVNLMAKKCVYMSWVNKLMWFRPQCSKFHHESSFKSQLFENALQSGLIKKWWLGVLVWMAKTGKSRTFENTNVTTAIIPLSQTLLKSVSVWTAKQFEKDNVDREHFIYVNDKMQLLNNLALYGCSLSLL